MSSFNIKSKVIANRDAAPAVITDAILARGTVQESIGTDKLPTTADIGSQARLCTVPSSARLSSLERFNAGIGTSALDVAVWYPTVVAPRSGITASALISSSTFAQNIAGVDTGDVADSLGTISQLSAQKRCMPLWQALGLTTDPNIDLDIGFTVRTTNSVGAYVGLRARYIR
jgi:hypothetical protein